jgi:outer membrane protein assembly factor BamB
MERRLALALLFGAAATAQTADWPRFRGPDGRGVSDDGALAAQIDRDKNVAWSVKTPRGNSSPIVVGGRVILTGHEGERRLLLCYDAATGEERWRKSLDRARAETFHPRNGPTTPTPVSDGRNVYAFFPDIGLLAYTDDGRELWRAPMGPFASVQGLASSPIHAAGNVVLLVDTPEEAYLAAFDARSGRQAWRTDRLTGVLGSYATPTVHFPHGGSPQVVVAGAMELTAYDAATGKRVWWAAGVSSFPSGPPFVDGDSVYTVEPGGGVSWPPFAEPLGLFDSNKVYLASLEGKVSVLRAGADWQVLSTGDLGEDVVATPAIADGKVFIRSETTLYAFASRPR